MKRPPLYPLAILAAQIRKGAPKGSYDATVSRRVLLGLYHDGMRGVVLSGAIHSCREYYEAYIESALQVSGRPRAKKGGR